MKPTQITPIVILNGDTLTKQELKSQIKALGRLAESAHEEEQALIDLKQLMRDSRKAIKQLNRFGK